MDWPGEADAPAEKPLPRRRRSVEYYLFTVLAVISAGLTLAFDIACFFPAFLGEKIDPLPVVLVGTLWGGAWTALCVVLARQWAARPVPRRRRSSVAYCLFVVLAVIFGAYTSLLLAAPVMFSYTDTDWTPVWQMLPFCGGLTALWAWLARRTRVRSQNPDPTSESPAAQTPEPAPPSESIELRLGGWAEVVGGNRRFIGRVGKIVAIDSNYVVLKWKGSRGKRYFRHIHVVPAATEDQPDGRLTPKSSPADPAAGPAPTMHSPWSSKTATAQPFPQTLTSARNQVPKVKGFWAGLPTMGRLAVVAAPVVVLAAIIVAGASSGNSVSYRAGAESGAQLERDIRELGGPRSSDEDIERGCKTLAETPAEIGYDVHWDGGIIPLSDFDADDYKRGCVDGSLKARG